MDCLEAMKQMPDNAFDLAVVDPPYGDGSQVVQVERERERETVTERGQGSGNGLTATNTRLARVNRGGVAREEQIPPRDGIWSADCGRGKPRRVGGQWAAKYEKNHNVGRRAGSRVF